MGLKEQIQYEKTQMHPWRWRMIYLGVPLYLLLSLGGTVAAVLVDVFMLGAVNGPGVLTFVGIGWFVLATVVMFTFSKRITRLEVKREMEKYGYLFKDPAPFEKEKFLFGDEKDGVRMTFDKDGFTIQFDREDGEQVFEEINENVFFIEWNDAEICLATQTLFRSAHIALAVIVRAEEAEGPAVFPIPMSEELFSAMHKFGLMERTGTDWAYLFYNPEDAFRQILATGMVRRMKNKKTGKTFLDEQGNFTP